MLPTSQFLRITTMRLDTWQLLWRWSKLLYRMCREASKVVFYKELSFNNDRLKLFPLFLWEMLIKRIKLATCDMVVVSKNPLVISEFQSSRGVALVTKNVQALLVFVMWGSSQTMLPVAFIHHIYNQRDGARCENKNSERQARTQHLSSALLEDKRSSGQGLANCLRNSNKASFEGKATHLDSVYE